MAMTPALPRQGSACSRTRTEAVSNGQANDSFVESTLAMATLFLLRTAVARSELLLLCMYGARVRNF